MNQEDIVDRVRCFFRDRVEQYAPPCVMDEDEKALLALVKDIVAMEREACAKLADAWSELSQYPAGVVAGAKIAEAIRARSETV